jgi:hypothetical protein
MVEQQNLANAQQGIQEEADPAAGMLYFFEVFF